MLAFKPLFAGVLGAWMRAGLGGERGAYVLVLEFGLSSGWLGADERLIILRYPILAV